MSAEAGREATPEYARHDECGGPLVVRVDGSTFCARCGDTVLSGSHAEEVVSSPRAPTSGGQGFREATQHCEAHEQQNCCEACPMGGCRFCVCRRDYPIHLGLRDGGTRCQHGRTATSDPSMEPEPTPEPFVGHCSCGFTTDDQAALAAHVEHLVQTGRDTTTPEYLCNCGQTFPSHLARAAHIGGCPVMQAGRQTTCTCIPASEVETDADGLLVLPVCPSHSLTTPVGREAAAAGHPFTCVVCGKPGTCDDGSEPKFVGREPSPSLFGLTTDEKIEQARRERDAARRDTTPERLAATECSDPHCTSYPGVCRDPRHDPKPGQKTTPRTCAGCEHVAAHHTRRDSVYAGLMADYRVVWRCAWDGCGCPEYVKAKP